MSQRLFQRQPRNGPLEDLFRPPGSAAAPWPGVAEGEAEGAAGPAGEAVAAGADEAPLPEGWTRRVDGNGRSLFVNEATRDIMAVHPATAAATATAAAAAAAAVEAATTAPHPQPRRGASDISYQTELQRRQSQLEQRESHTLRWRQTSIDFSLEDMDASAGLSQPPSPPSAAAAASAAAAPPYPGPSSRSGRRHRRRHRHWVSGLRGLFSRNSSNTSTASPTVAAASGIPSPGTSPAAGTMASIPAPAAPGRRPTWWRRRFRGHAHSEAAAAAPHGQDPHEMSSSVWTGLQQLFRGRHRREHAAQDDDDAPAFDLGPLEVTAGAVNGAEGHEALLQLFMETLAFAVMDQQEQEQAESEMARLERLQEINRLQAALDSLEQEYQRILQGKPIRDPDVAVLAEAAGAARPGRSPGKRRPRNTEELVVSHLHRHPLRRIAADLVAATMVCSASDSPAGCGGGSDVAEGMFECTQGCDFLLCAQCTQLQPMDSQVQGQAVKTAFHEHDLVPVTDEPIGWSCGARAHPHGCDQDLWTQAAEGKPTCYQCANGCAFFLCSSCIKIKPEGLVSSPLHQHLLTRVPSDGTWLCDARTHHHGCTSRSAEDMQDKQRFRCIAGCDFSLCETCCRILPDDQVVYKACYLHPHALVENYQDNGWACDAWAHPRGCGRGMGQTCGVRRFRCSQGCDFDLCDQCVELRVNGSASGEELTLMKKEVEARMVFARLMLYVARIGDALVVARQLRGNESEEAAALERQLRMHLDLLSRAGEGGMALELMMEQERQHARLAAEEVGGHGDPLAAGLTSATGNGVMDDPSSATLDYRIECQRLRLTQLRRRNGGKVMLEVRRDHLLADSKAKVMCLSVADLHRRLFISFAGEDGKDVGGVAREWFYLLGHEACNPADGYFEYSAQDLYTLQIRADTSVSTAALVHYEFVGRILGLAVFHGNLVDAFFIRPFYKLLLGQKISLCDMESVDADYHRGLMYLLNNPAGPLDLTFTVDRPSAGGVETIELKPGGGELPVTDDNKAEYVRLVMGWRFSSGIRRQMRAILKGFLAVVKNGDIQPFSPGELELLLCGVAELDVEQWQECCDYHNGYEAGSEPVQHFWAVVRSWDSAMRAKLLQFVTGTSRLPSEGFAGLTGTNGPCRFSLYRSGDHTVLPVGHTCINRLDLPPYRSVEEAERKLLLAIHEGGGFGLE